jgi:hypothetical protein
MIALNGNSNLRFGFLEVARGPSSQIMRADHSVVCRRAGCHATVTAIVEKLWKVANKSEYGREVGSRASSQLTDSPRKTSAPVKCNKTTRMPVNRTLGITGQNCARIQRFQFIRVTFERKADPRFVGNVSSYKKWTELLESRTVRPRQRLSIQLSFGYQSIEPRSWGQLAAKQTPHPP